MTVEQLTLTLGESPFQFRISKTEISLDESVSLDATQEDAENNVTITTDDSNKENRLSDIMRTPARGFRHFTCTISN